MGEDLPYPSSRSRWKTSGVDPVTVVVSAIALGAVAGLRDAATEAVKDAYAVLRRLVRDRYAEVDLGAVERRPDSAAKRESLTEDLIAEGAADDAEVLAAARTVLAAVREHESSAAEVVGVDLDEIEAAAVQIADVTSTQTGVKVRRAKVAGAIDIRGVQAGEGSPHPR